MGVEEKLPSGILLTTVEKVAGYARKSSVWPATFGLACCAIELMQTGGPRHDLARFGMERASNTPRQADLMIVAGRVSQKMAPVLRQIYDQMADPKWVISMGVCASSGGMFNNYAIVKLHDKIRNMKLGVNREREVTELEEARLRRLPLATDLAGSQSRTAPDSGPTLLGSPALPSAAVRSRNLGMTSPPVHHEARATETQAAEVRATEAGGAGE
jgi:NADH-quinone oxidoreductase subunit B